MRGSDWGGGVGGLLYSVRGGTPSFKHYNARGDILAESNATGATTWRAQYDAYGTRAQKSGTPSADRQRGNTKDEDPSGFRNDGFRYYDLDAQIYVTADPAGFVDGPNLYCYVVQNPWSKFDPEGLNAVSDWLAEKFVAGAIDPFMRIGAGAQTLQMAANVSDPQIYARLSAEGNKQMWSGAGEVAMQAQATLIAPLAGPVRSTLTPALTRTAETSSVVAVARDIEVVAAVNAESKVAAAAAENIGAKSAMITRNNARQLLRQQGVSEAGAREAVDSFAGKQIQATQGRAGDSFVVTESAAGKAKANYVTRESAGATPLERQQNLALPTSNTAEVETGVTLTKDKMVLEGPVASKAGQEGFYPHATGGGDQVYISGGRRDGTVADK